MGKDAVMLTPEQKADKAWKKKLIGYIIAQVLIYIGPLVIPTWASVTEMGVKMLCVFIATLFMFMFTGDLLCSSLLGMLGAIIHGYVTLNGGMQTVFGNSSSVQMVAMMAFVYAINKSKGFVILGRKIIRASRFAQKSPMLFSLVFMICMYIVTWYIGGFACVFTIIPMFEGIAATVGYKKEDKWHKVMITLLYMLAGSGTYTRGTSGLVIGWLGIYQNALPFEWTYEPFKFMISSRASLLVATIVMVYAAKLIFGCDMTKLAKVDFESIDELKGENCKFNKEQKILLILFFIAIVRSLISNPFAEGSVAYTVYSVLDLKMCCFIGLTLGSVIRVDKKPLINPEESFAHVPWGVFMCLGSMMVIAGAISSVDLGIRAWIADILAPLFGSDNYLVFCFMILLVTSVITNLMSNQATIMIMLTIVATYADKFAANYDLTPLCGAVCCVGNIAFLTWACGPICAYYLSRDEIDQKFAFTVGAPMILIAVICFTLGSVVFGGIFA